MASPKAQRPPRTPRNNRATAVHLRLRNQIVSGHFPQGSALAEPTLAEHFQTSRAPVREALIALEREGLVHRGLPTTFGEPLRLKADEDKDRFLERARLSLMALDPQPRRERA